MIDIGSWFMHCICNVVYLMQEHSSFLRPRIGLGRSAALSILDIGAGSRPALVFTTQYRRGYAVLHDMTSISSRQNGSIGLQ